MNKKYLPEGIHKPGRMTHGTYKSYQDGSSNLVAIVCQDNTIVRLVSTNSNPRNVDLTNPHSKTEIIIIYPDKLSQCQH